MIVVRRQEIFKIDWKQVSVTLQGMLTALGKCKDMVHIRLHPSSSQIPANCFNPLWSRGDFVQMVQRVQENGAADLWRLELRVAMLGGQEGCDAMRIGWLDVPRQPKLKGEWRFCIRGSSSDSDVPTSALGASVEAEIGGRTCWVCNMCMS